MMNKKKLFFKLTFTLFFCLAVAFGSFFNFRIRKTAVADSLTAEIVMEVGSNRVLHAKNQNEKRFMASTTKILTCITIIENCNLSDIVTITDKTVGVEGSSIYLEVGEKLSVLDLLYGLMLRSGNDCAETLAVYCSGSIENFAILMNETANKIGAKDSNFVNPHGLHDNNHYTTAYDLALISCYAMKNADFRKIVGTKVTKIPFTTRDYDRVLINKNKMLSEFEGATGIKTGYTKKAGRCLVSSCNRDGMELVSVVLNCPSMFERSKEILDTTFCEYKNYKLIESDNFVGFTQVKTDKNDVKCGLYVKNDVVLPLTEYEKENLKIDYKYEEEICRPVEKDEEIGEINFYCQNNLIFSQKIYTIIGVD